jgi:outer membrane protein OmpA-like peptidoglycan-associated protein
MDFCWHGFSFPVLGRGSLHLMRRLDATVVRKHGEGEWEEASRTRWYFAQAAGEDPYRLRRFVVNAGLGQLSPRALSDLALVNAVKALIDSGDLVGVYRGRSGGAKAKASDNATQQRQLVREFERETRGSLVNSGRTYKLTADVDLAAVRDRERYEVVGQRDAQRILDEVAGQTGTSAGLAALLAQARDRLTRDWRPPLQPNGLILLRRVLVPRAQVVDTDLPMTPSQIRKAKLGWIIVEAIDDQDQPWNGTVQMTSTDGSQSSYNFANAGVFSRENIEPGSVTLVYDAGATSAAEPASTAETPAQAPSPDEGSPNPDATEGEPATEQPDEPMMAAGRATKKKRAFSVTVVDEVPNPISGVDLSFQQGDSPQSVPTDSQGLAKCSLAGSDSVRVTFSSASDLAEVMKPIWTPCRGVERKNWAKADDNTTVVTLFAGGVYKVVADDSTMDTTRPKETLEPFLGVQATPVESGETSAKVATLTVQPLVIMVRMLGEHFDTDKCFLLPKALDDVRDLVRLHKEYNLTDLLIVGHTDTRASDEHNLVLSLDRTSAMRAYLTNDAKTWLSWYNSDKQQSKRWGTTEDSYMINTLLGDKDPPATVLDYQQWHNALTIQEEGYEPLKEDGQIGPATRKQLILDYMHRPDTTVPDGTTIQVHGCGEFFPLDASEEALDTNAPDEDAEQRNRRVEVFLFPKEVGILPPVPGEKAKKGEPEYPEWRRRSVDVRFGPPSGKNLARVRLHDAVCNPLPFVAYQVTTPGYQTGECMTDGEGWAYVPIGPECPATPIEIQWDKLDNGEFIYSHPVILDCGSGAKDSGVGKLRLKNLGYGDDVKTAVDLFRFDYGLTPVTLTTDGTIDQDTLDQLNEIFEVRKCNATRKGKEKA